MSNSINTNTAASYAATNISKSTALLQKSMSRLSSGSRIVDASDDAGGLAVSMKLKASLSRTDAAATNISNAISMLQTQGASLANFSGVVTRMSELAVRIKDATQNSTDLANYFAEYAVLKDELDKIEDDQFNGISLFKTATGSSTLTVHVREDGTFAQDVDLPDLAGDADLAVVRAVTNADDIKALSGEDYTTALQKLATFTAKLGASLSELQNALERNRTMKLNLEQANSRIEDVDVAAETTRLAKSKVLVDAGASALSQANQSKDALLRLLQ